MKLGIYPKGSFLEFYDQEFWDEVDAVEIPGMPNASWDRKAAYLLWRERATVDFDDLL